jgi:hypothetical protein
VSCLIERDNPWGNIVGVTPFQVDRRLWLSIIADLPVDAPAGGFVAFGWEWY